MATAFAPISATKVHDDPNSGIQRTLNVLFPTREEARVRRVSVPFQVTRERGDADPNVEQGRGEGNGDGACANRSILEFCQRAVGRRSRKSCS